MLKTICRWYVHGIAPVILGVIVWYAVYFFVSLQDAYWYENVFSPRMGQIPLLGFMLSTALFCVLGAVREVLYGTILYRAFYRMSPSLAGFLFVNKRVASFDLLEPKCVLVQLHSLHHWRAAKVTAPRRCHDGTYMVCMISCTAPPSTDTFDDNVIVLAERMEDGQGNVYPRMMPLSRGIQIEFTAGTMLPEDALSGCDFFLLRDVLIAEGYVPVDAGVRQSKLRRAPYRLM